VSNGFYIDGKAADGMRKALTEEFSAIYCFNLRGDQINTSGESSRAEGGKIFGSGSRSSIAITLMVRNATAPRPCRPYYYDIGSYLSRERKLKIIQDFGSIAAIPWMTITPNSDNDWINQRDPAFQIYIPMGDRKAGADGRVLFSVYSNGVQSNRESWVWNFGEARLSENIGGMINFYNSQVAGYAKVKARNLGVDSYVDNDGRRIGWTRSLKSNLGKLVSGVFRPERIVTGMHRPFCKQKLYFDRFFNEYVNVMPNVFPCPSSGNVLMSVAATGSNKGFSAFVSNVVPDVEMIAKGQCFPLYYYEHESAVDLFAKDKHANVVRREAITDSALTTCRRVYEEKGGISKGEARVITK
jgi:predicted helicase